jgi:hypothetical protein
MPRERKMDHEEEMPVAMMVDETPSPVPMDSVVPTVEAQSDSEKPEETGWNMGPDPGVNGINLQMIHLTERAAYSTSKPSRVCRGGRANILQRLSRRRPVAIVVPQPPSTR